MSVAVYIAANEARHWSRVCSRGDAEILRLRATLERWAPVHTRAVDRGLDVEWLSVMLLSAEIDLMRARFALRSARAKLARWILRASSTHF